MRPIFLNRLAAGSVGCHWRIIPVNVIVLFKHGLESRSFIVPHVVVYAVNGSVYIRTVE